MKKPIFKNWWFWVGLIVVLGLIGSQIEDDEKTVAKEPVAKEISLEEVVTDIIHKKAGYEVNEEDSIVSLSINEGTVKAVIKNMPVSENTIKRGLFMRTSDILEEIHKIEEISLVSIEWKIEFIDTYGNGEYKSVMKIDMTRETLDKIAWKDFDYMNIEKIADEYWQLDILN